MPKIPVIPWDTFWPFVEADLASRGWGNKTLWKHMSEVRGGIPDTHYTRLKRARQRGYIDLYMADDYLNALSLHLFDIPGFDWDTVPEEKVWAGPVYQPDDRTPNDPAKRGEAEQMIRDGVSLSEVSRRCDIPRRTLRGWRDRMQVAA